VDTVIKPYYEEPGITIYHGDCREIMPELQPVDMVVTDPPHGIGDRMQGGTWGAASQYSDFRKWDKKPDSDIFPTIINMGSTVIIWGGNHFELPPSRGWLVWDKKRIIGTLSDCELAWTNIDRPIKKFSWFAAAHKFGHPTEKPLELIKWCVEFAPGVVLDPFMGSGTTLRAAKDLGRKAIGIEIEEKYCQIAALRLQQEVLFK
jgi:DNA modification methylase